MSAEYQVDGSVAVITLNNPPVNGLGLATRAAAVDGIKRALADAAVKAIVITGAGKAFSGSADIKEFNSPKALAEPSLATLIATAEGASKPVVAAIHSVCMGGGLELALGCHYRVALPGVAQIALPEVKLGLLPGADVLPAAPAARAGPGDGVEHDRLRHAGAVGKTGQDGAVRRGVHCRHRPAGRRRGLRRQDRRRPSPLPKVRERKVDYPNHEAFLRFSRNTVKAMSGPFPAPLKCVETVAAAVTMKFDDGVRGVRTRVLPGLDADHRVEGAAPCLLRRARRQQGAGRAVGHADPRHPSGAP